MSEQDRKRAEEVWRDLIKIYQQTNGQKAFDEGTTCVAAALAQARREGEQRLLAIIKEADWLFDNYPEETATGAEDAAWTKRWSAWVEVTARLLAKEEGRG